MTGSPTGGAWRQIKHLFVEGTAAGLSDQQLLDRFLATGNETAFAALVQRHGPMVLAICRSVLRNPADAEDAFQATFLVLVRKGRSIRSRETLGGWLRQIAHRIAIQAGIDSARRRVRERSAGLRRADVSPQDEPEDDWRLVLHEELSRLSDRYRLPLLLCDLEGKTHAEAAAELGCGPATVQRRLNAARAVLRSRLTRRGVALSAGTLAATIGRPAVAAVPPAWVHASVQAAGVFASRAGRAAIGEMISTTAADLVRKSLQAMLLSQLRTAVVLVVLVVAMVGPAWRGLAGPGQAGARDASRMPGPQPAPAASSVQVPIKIQPAGPGEIITYQGRVLDPDGKPFAGAAIDLVSYGLKHPEDPPVRATSGADGRFRFEVRKSDFDTTLEDHPWTYPTILARAPGLAFGVGHADASSREWTLRLARDDVPIVGRIIDLQGRPAAEVTVKVVSVRATSTGRLDEYLKALQERNEVISLEHPFLRSRMEAQPEPPVIPPVRTDVDGRFRIAGIGRERIATLHIEGPTIETERVRVRTRPGTTLRIPAHAVAINVKVRKPDLVTIYGAMFEHVAGPTRPIEGTVRDLDSGQPLAGIMVRGEDSLESGIGTYVDAVTDAQGRYRLVGLPQGREGHVLVVPPCDFPYYGRRKALLHVPPDESLPYLHARVPVGQSQAPGPAPLDINLKRGVWLNGRLIDRRTRKPVRGQVEYGVSVDNPHMQEFPAFRSARIGPYFTDSNGSFHFAAFPGLGMIVARADGSGYVRAVGVEKLKGRRENGLVRTYPDLGLPDNFNVLDEIDPAPNAGSMTHDLLLESGHSLTLTVLGPEGQRLNLTDLFAIGLKDMNWWEKVPPGSSRLEIQSLAPGRSRTVGIRHEAKRLAGELVLRGDETQPRTMTLQPWGVLIGRVIDADGQPNTGGGNLYPITLPTGYPEVDKDGRFRVEGLVPGKPYDIGFRTRALIDHGFLARGVKLDPGKTRDLGDVMPRRSENP